MKYTVACNWDLALLDRIDYPEVRSVFGGLPDSLIASGRPSNTIRKLSDAEVAEYIREVHKKGWDFDYNMNSTCLSNMEFTAEGHKKILEYIDRMLNLGVDSLTIAIPFLIELINKHFPGTKMKVSTYQKIDSVAMAKRFEDLGVTSIMLSEHVNRDFELLKAIRKSVKVKLLLVANVGCVNGCPNMHSHANCTSHSGTKGGINPLYSEYYQTTCLLSRLKDPAELMKIRWIRPEDVSVYEDLGIDMLKITERNSTTDVLAERVKAYHDRSYDGNLLNLIGQMLNVKASLHSSGYDQQKPASREEFERAFKFTSEFYTTNITDLYYLDNKKVPENFLRSFESRDCTRQSCSDCNFCKRAAEKCIRISSEEQLSKTVDKISRLKNGIVEGSTLY